MHRNVRFSLLITVALLEVGCGKVDAPEKTSATQTQVQTESVDLQAQTQNGPYLLHLDEVNCSTVSGMTQGMVELAANYFRASVSQISLLRTSYEIGPYGGKGCVSIISHPQGVAKCSTDCAVSNRGKILIHNCVGGYNNNSPQALNMSCEVR